MTAPKHNRRLAGFILAIMGLACYGATCAWGLVLNLEWLLNPKRPHSRRFDLLGLGLCLPGTLFFGAVVWESLGEPGGASICLAFFVYATAWVLWVRKRCWSVWPTILRKRREAKQDSELRRAMTLPASDRLKVRIGKLRSEE